MEDNMKRAHVLWLIIVLSSIFAFAAVFISRDVVREAMKMRGTRFTERNAIGSKVNGFFRDFKLGKYELAKIRLKNKDDLNSIMGAIDREIDYFFIIEDTKISRTTGKVTILVKARHKQGEKKGVLAEGTCEIGVEKVSTGWKLANLSDFVQCIKGFSDENTRSVESLE
jgi:hypothetical protein